MSASWNGATRRVEVLFDMDLVAGGLDTANWILGYSGGGGGGGTVSPSSATATGNKVTLQFGSISGPVQIEFDPPPFDVVGAPPNGMPASGFVRSL